MFPAKYGAHCPPRGHAAWQDIHICAWCMPKGIPGTHGICPKCYRMQLARMGLEPARSTIVTPLLKEAGI